MLTEFERGCFEEALDQQVTIRPVDWLRLAEIALHKSGLPEMVALSKSVQVVRINVQYPGSPDLSVNTVVLSPRGGAS